MKKSAFRQKCSKNGLHSIWSEWRDLNSRPLDPQTLRLGFVREKLRKYGIFGRFQNIRAQNIPYFLYFANPFHRYSTAGGEKEILLTETFISDTAQPLSAEFHGRSRNRE